VLSVSSLRAYEFGEEGFEDVFLKARVLHFVGKHVASREKMVLFVFELCADLLAVEPMIVDAKDGGVVLV
jgi:hypothetical protein